MNKYLLHTTFGITLQGEGLHAGWPCVFVRLTGCNAWDGRPESRAHSACPYCDTDFRGGEWCTATDILSRLDRLARPGCGCVLTGGEPLLQADATLLHALGERFPWVDIETNGTRPCPPRPANVFLSCSPKQIPGQPVVLDPDWWKLLIPVQAGFLERALASKRPVYVQPLCPDAGPAGAAYDQAIADCLELAYRHGCRLSLQLHKYLGIE